MAAGPSARAFRDLLGRMPTGVTVITTAGPAGVAGMTASSVCSVSLEPLLLLVCVDNRAGTLAAVRGNGRFAVNLLGADQAEVSAAFAGRRPAAEKFAAADHDLIDGVPVLRRGLGWLTCRVAAAHLAGDHTVVIGEVVGLHGHDSAAADPLVWVRGGYRLAAV
jgi:flavin reductase (DIM6/NTAB) family NADH-FMN oxidoreductase RutF